VNEVGTSEEGWDAESEIIRQEIETILLDEGTQLSDIWRRTQEGESPEQIRVALGNQRTNFVWNYLRIGKVIVEGDLPTAPTVAQQCARTLRRFLKEHAFSPGARSILEDRLKVLESRVADPVARSEEEQAARSATKEAEERGEPGVYVYSLPHYIRYPYDEESGRTLLKVGKSDRDMIRRFREQVRTTALPEDPVLLRIYPMDQGMATEKEKVFHRLLEAADHDRSKARTGGTEWFLTTTKFLDEVARTLDLEVRDVSDLADSAVVPEE
jgi:hypothetical protein